MKKLNNIFLILALTISSGILLSQENVSTVDYSKAEKMLGFNASKYVDRMNVRPNWLPNQKFWYNVLVPEGKEFVLIDPNTKSRKTADSHSTILEGIDLPEKVQSNRNATASPDGKSEVFIRDWNLWIRNITSGEEKQLTFDGTENFGYATDNAGWRQSDRPIVLWSPDSKKIATFRQDQRHVSDMHLVTTNVGEPTLKSWKYPLPEDEDIIRIHRIIIDLDAEKIITFNIPPDPRRGTLCDDISCTGAFDDNEWSSDGSSLAFVSSSRDHKIAKFRVADAATGDVKDIFTETVETQYESGQGGINWKFLPDTKEFIWYSERDDWGHLYLYDLNTGKIKTQITKGNWVVTEVKEFDVKNRKIIFEANGRESGRDPYYSHLYSVNFDGSALQLLTPENGNHNIYLSPDNQYFVDNYSQPDIPPVSVLRKITGELIMTLEKADISRLTSKGWKPPTSIKVKSADGNWDLYGLMYVPSNLDENKKYPIVNYIYPGPQGGSVGSRSFNPGRRDHQALAELGFIVVAIDGSCNPGRSKSFHDACYGDMGSNTLPDQIEGMKQLAKKHPFIDLDKIGIWGHSGGGFATATALLKYPDIFKVGIAESGNHDNRNYEDDWGERYIGLVDGNNYEVQANQLYAENLKGKLMLAHGGMDDNVPPYNTYLLVDALIKANKDFDLLILPNARHGFGSDSFYMTRKRWDYFVTNLQGKTPPKEFKINYVQDPRNVIYP
jgi:dipeptidyl aminopeptidase/acylaminoacyl peptidase